MGKLKKKTSVLCSGKRYYKIPWFEDYCININGEIRLWKNPDIIIKRYYLNGISGLVILRQNHYLMIIRIERLMMNIFTGKLDYKILYKDGDKLNVSLKNLSYEVPDEDIIHHIFANKPFKQIPNFSRYWISEDAIIWNDRSRNFMRIGYDLQGYPNLHLMNDAGKDIHTKPHILLMNTWGPEKPDPRMVCNHIDSIEYHNTLDNLEWVYQYENIYESYMTNDQKYDLIASKEDVERACKMIADGYNNRMILEELFKGKNTKQKSIYKWLGSIRNKKSWKWISDKYF